MCPMKSCISVTLVLIICLCGVALSGHLVSPTNPSKTNPLSSFSITRVRGLRVNETVHPESSDLSFTWESCDFCSSYDLTIDLNHVSGQRFLQYDIAADVTSFTIGNVLPKTKYHLGIKAVPLNTVSSAQVEGITFSKEAPSPVRKLQILPLTKTSLQAKWSSDVTDGFLIKVLNGTALVQERVLLYKKESELEISGLLPDTKYEIQVVAFFEPITANSCASAVISSGRTLPSEMPDLQFRWEEYMNVNFKLLWTNPSWPSPLRHNVHCYDITNSQLHYQKMDLTLSGLTDQLAVGLEPNRRTELKCTLQTWFSSVFSVESDLFIPIVHETKSPVEYISCGGRGLFSPSISVPTHGYSLSVSSCDESKMSGFQSEFLRVQFESKSAASAAVTVVNEYQLCNHESCSGWINVPNGLRRHSEDSSNELVLRLGPGDLSPWTSYFLRLRASVRCQYAGYSNMASSAQNEQIFHLPKLPGIVPSVDFLQLAHEKNTTVVSWNYTDVLKPDYFLLTRCSSRSWNQTKSSAICSSLSLPPNNRSLTLTSLDEGHSHYIFVHAAKMHRKRIIRSESRTAAFYLATHEELLGKINISTDEIINSSNVQLQFDYSSISELSDFAEFLVSICGKSLPIWEEAVVEEMAEMNESCENFTMAGTNATLDFFRRPWTEYAVTVRVRVGLSSSESVANTTLAIYKSTPDPVTNFLWNKEDTLLSWDYLSSLKPSGFLISVCISFVDTTEPCSNITTGRFSRDFRVDLDDYPNEALVVFISPFITFEHTMIKGLSSSLVIYPPAVENHRDLRHSNDDYNWQADQPVEEWRMADWANSQGHN